MNRVQKRQAIRKLAKEIYHGFPESFKRMTTRQERKELALNQAKKEIN